MAKAGWAKAGRGIAWLALMLGAYPVAGAIGGAVPVNTGWRPPARGVTVFVESNGVHTGLVVPKLAAGVDWRDLARPEDLADPRYARWDWLAIGWGERRFYLETPTWADVKPGSVLAAAVGSDAVLLHLDHLPRPVAGPDERPVTLRPDEYRRLAAYIRASVAPGGRHYRGYDVYDAFVDARGRYSAAHTCNEWVGAGLRAAGVRVGWWTPFAGTVTRWF